MSCDRPGAERADDRRIGSAPAFFSSLSLEMSSSLSIGMFSNLSLEKFVRDAHPLPRIRPLIDHEAIPRICPPL